MWVAEVPNMPGLYANRREDRLDRTHPDTAHMVTPKLEKALQFKDEAECKQWCDDNPTPPFTPKEITE